MPNYCNYEMKIKGSKEKIKEVIDTLKADYNYGEGKPSHKHMFRVFEVYEEELFNEGNGIYSQYVAGYCAWSVSSCMLDGDFSYYNQVKNNYPNIFMGTTLKELSKDCIIEVFSEEEGMEFSEHYIFENGVCVLDDTCDTEMAGYNDKGEITTDIDWDTYDGEYTCLNPHREAPNDIYRWEI